MNKHIIFLTGFMASGKTTIGKLLARKLSLPYYDTDELIEKRARIPIFKIFEQYGEDYFRKLENEVLVKVIEKLRKTGGVVSTGGGLPCYHNNMELMKRAGNVVYIEVNPDDVVRRIRKAELRPVYRKLLEKENPLQEIKNLMKTREKYYLQADLCVDNSYTTGWHSAESVVEEIINGLNIEAHNSTG